MSRVKELKRQVSHDHDIDRPRYLSDNALKALDELAEMASAARDALISKGYRESCDIPACNCGDQWNHGGHAEYRLKEIHDALGDLTNGTTALKVIQGLIQKARSAQESEHGENADDRP